jgi:asparaginyl-tRNA synthetase
VKISGWVAHVREARKNMAFIELRDGTGYIQCVLAGQRLASAAIIRDKLLRESSIEVRGTVSRIPSGQHPPAQPRASAFEVQVDWWRLVGPSEIELEKMVTQESDIPQKLDMRHIVLRGARASSMLVVRSDLLRGFREWYWAQRFVEVTPPTIVQTFCEGGSDLFKVDYYSEPAYMTQSSQLYLETVIPAVHDTFCVLPSFRAEKSRTPRHLSEYTHLEAEMAFIEFPDLLQHLESIICDVIAGVVQRCGDLIRHFNPAFKPPERPFVRMTYGDAIQYCRDHNILNNETGKPFEYGEDITEKPEREMTNQIGKPILLMRFPTAMKAFYMRKCADNPEETESVDVLMPGVGEIVGGSMRIHDGPELMAAYKRVGIDPKPYYWFTDQRRFGTCPHGGYGLGVERLLMWLLGEDHIRNTCLYPRYVGRCYP